MPTTTINSSLFKVYKGGTAIAQSNSAEITLNQELPDLTNKDSGRWSENTDGRLSGSGSVEGLANMAIIDDLYVSLTTKGGHAVIMSTEVSGDTFLSGTARFSNVSFSSPSNNEPVTYSANFTFSGEVTKGTVS